MDNKKKFLKQLNRTLQILTQDPGLKHHRKSKIFEFNKKGDNPLLSISNTTILMPVTGIIESMLGYKSPLKDTFIDLNLLRSFTKELSRRKAMKGIYHIGFCYKVDSQISERKRVKKAVSSAPWNLAEIPSNDFALWLFVGDKSNWKNTCIELLPVENPSDSYRNYWIPSVHIAIKNTLPEQDLERIAHEGFHGNRNIIRNVVIDNEVRQVRIWLGIISGISIALDFSIKIK